MPPSLYLPGTYPPELAIPLSRLLVFIISSTKVLNAENKPFNPF